MRVVQLDHGPLRPDTHRGRSRAAVEHAEEEEEQRVCRVEAHSGEYGQTLPALLDDVEEEGAKRKLHEDLGGDVEAEEGYRELPLRVNEVGRDPKVEKKWQELLPRREWQLALQRRGLFRLRPFLGRRRNSLRKQPERWVVSGECVPMTGCT